MAVGADGAIYVADWYDPIVGGHQMQDGKGYGRIYRITPKGRTLTTPPIDLRTTAGQVQALLSPAVNVRSSGFERLEGAGRRGGAGREARPHDPNPYHRARAIWLLGRLVLPACRKSSGSSPTPIHRSASRRSVRCGR